MNQIPEQPDAARLFASHPRTWRDNLYVYPVISRRSGGLSIGINLNPDKACNFDCVYCQVDRTVPPVVRKVDLDRLRIELDQTLEAAVTGRLLDDPQFGQVPDDLRRMNDIAFSGDGEPTASPVFLPAVRMAAAMKKEKKLDAVKIVLITDAAYLDHPAVREALGVMDANQGEIWAKLDAGTEAYYQKINRPNVPLSRIHANILEAAQARPIVIQSLWMRVHGQEPPEAEVDAFAHRLREIVDVGGRIKLVQIYTIARQTAEPWVTPLPVETLDRMAAHVRSVVDLPTAVWGT